jgi:hypothetical protein
MQWRTAKMSWSRESPPESVGGTTKVLVSKGFRVFGSVRKQADADRLQREFGAGFVPLIMDITDAEAVHQAAQKVGSMTGDRNLVGLVNSAGIVVSGPLPYLRPSEYRRQLEINMVSPLVVIQRERVPADVSLCTRLPWPHTALLARPLASLPARAFPARRQSRQGPRRHRYQDTSESSGRVLP